MSLLHSIALLFLATAALLVGGCAHNHTAAQGTHARTSAHHAAPDREYNPVTGNYERQPPFGPRSVKPIH